MNEILRFARRHLPVAVNDIHSKLNACQMQRLIAVQAPEDIAACVRGAQRQGAALAIAGGKHAMGGQQFLQGGWLLDTRALNRVLSFEVERGRIEVQAGIQWPQLIRHYLQAQQGRARQWGIAQKQTGADRLSVGGAIAANIHGRGLNFRPFSQDVLAFTLIDARGEQLRCSRAENAELFSLVVGGYGLFGVVASATLQLHERRQVQRIVTLLDVEALPEAFAQRRRDGYLYGDFQFAIDARDEHFLRRGVFSCYRPLDGVRAIPADQIRLSHQDWQALLLLAHRDKRQAFARFSDFYLRSSGQIYWSDTHQLNIYLDDYHGALDARLSSDCAGSEMITELYVPFDALSVFLDEARRVLRAHGADVIYGTIRTIRKDRDAFLAWAREDYACVILNLHVDHDAAAIAAARAVFRALIDIAIGQGGSYFLTYHRWANQAQLLSAYPQFPEFLAKKLQYDPQERFQSDWYQQHRVLLPAKV